MSNPEVNQPVDSHLGTVVSIKDGCAVVHFVRGSMCAHCGACMAFGEKEMEVVVKNDIGAVPGDTVTVVMLAKNILKAGLIAYVIPLIALLLGIWLGSLIADWASVVIGVSSCALSYLILHRLDKGFQKKQTFLPVMTSIVNDRE